MKNTHQQVLLDTQRWLQSGQAVWLGTVLKTWGSSPRPVGSVMAFSPGAGLSGSLSGGCIEEYLLEQLQAEEQDKTTPVLQVFGETVEQQERFSLPCGGTLLICLEYLRPSKTTLEHINALLDALNRRDQVTRVIDLDTGSLSLDYQSEYHQLSFNGGAIHHPFHPEWQMLLTGCGEVTRCVATLAQALDFSVEVCDFRPAFTEGWSMDGVKLHRGFPDERVQERFNDERTAIITLAHDPRVDDMALMAALKTHAFYIGAMGSRKTSESRRKRLSELDVSEAEIGRLHAPAGFATGSKTPWEIAVSIMAEVTAARSKQSVSHSADEQSLRLVHG
ncbi:XdhC family protein [Endozoicomonas arenosclerae]|uniref:XdhC family protein n=1 Tax=Endozoicomonas arenosclerae TaxID=1633495 RepID=UPI0007830F7E|nr:XdhC family protein [Endozoicomonas arenosclerae]